MNAPTCHTCGYYHRHYVLSEGTAVTCECGHCTCQRLKHKRPDSKACPSYQHRPNPPFPNRFETIHYLTTTVLDHILNLPLPPIIAESSESKNRQEEPLPVRKR